MSGRDIGSKLNIVSASPFVSTG